MPSAVLCRQLEFALRGVGFFGQLFECVEETRGLSGEQPVVRERCDGSLRAGKSVIARANYGAMRQIRVDEFAGNGKDQAGLH